MDAQVENQQDKNRGKCLKKIVTPIMKDGFQSLRMDDIAKLMDISRATMYKHFSSKEEVIEGVVRVFVDYIERLEDRSPDDDENDFGIWFQRMFEQSVTLVGKLSDTFLKELQTVYPDQYDVLKDALNEREKRIVRFYRDGMAKGIFHSVNEHFLMLQDDVLLREILNAKYLLSRDITFRQALLDYYRLKKTQLFKPEKASIVDDAKIEPIIDHLVEKYTRAL